MDMLFAITFLLADHGGFSGVFHSVMSFAGLFAVGLGAASAVHAIYRRLRGVLRPLS